MTSDYTVGIQKRAGRSSSRRPRRRIVDVPKEKLGANYDVGIDEGRAEAKESNAASSNKSVLNSGLVPSHGGSINSNDTEAIVSVGNVEDEDWMGLYGGGAIDAAIGNDNFEQFTNGGVEVSVPRTEASQSDGYNDLEDAGEIGGL